MSIQRMCIASAAAVLTVGMAAFGQTTGQAPTQAASQAGTEQETQITLVGCLQREADYRKANQSGRGGAVATGVGLGNEFVLVNATTGTGTSSTAETPAATSGAEADCATATGTGQAYELTGKREGELAKFVGRRIEITGMLKKAGSETAGTTGTAGTETKPSGGFDPLGQDLRLPEVNVTSFREVTRSPQAQAETAAPAATAASREPAPEPQPTAQEPASAPVGTSGQAEQRELPRTASPLPLAGLIGLLALGGVLAIRSRRH
jgi:hypothetical protein